MKRHPTGKGDFPISLRLVLASVHSVFTGKFKFWAIMYFSKTTGFWYKENDALALDETLYYVRYWFEFPWKEVGEGQYALQK